MQYTKNGMVLSDNAARSLSKMVVGAASEEDSYKICNGIAFLLVLAEVAKGNIPASNLHFKTISGKHLKVNERGQYDSVDGIIEESDFLFNHVKYENRVLYICIKDKIRDCRLSYPDPFTGVSVVYDPGAARRALSDFHADSKIKSIAQRVRSGDDFSVTCSSGILFEKMPLYVVSGEIPYNKVRLVHQGKKYRYSPLGVCEGIDHVLTHAEIEWKLKRIREGRCPRF